MKIKNILGREVYDSQGFPTLACDIFLENNTHVTAIVPAGTSTGHLEVCELRDGGKRLMGKGVQKAIANIANKIAPLFIGQEIDALEMDAQLLELDPTERKDILGGNTMIGVSMALFKAHAKALNIELYDFIARVLGNPTISLPVPLINVINGGAHGDARLPIQEFLIIPHGTQSFSAAMQASAEVFHTLKTLLQEQGFSTALGAEGGFMPVFDNINQPFDCIMQAIAIAGYDETTFGIGVDVASTQFYDEASKKYNWFGKSKSAQDMIDIYKQLADKYPLLLIEDGLAEQDWENWPIMMQELGSSLYLVADDLVVSNIYHIAKAIKKIAANAVIIKPNQVGTITQIFEAVELCKEYNLNMVASHRSRDSEDTFIADLAVGVGAQFIKSGGLMRSERLAKYNRLLFIEEAQIQFDF
ncbi:phosphopyruvate hydratase [candidate division TM6 bacterium RIFCSPHIGHO2_12_FULL_36_22]|nr:MAG: phosphopyruvate hydratase [candidate division TM6 bacterium RIFCSPHIGHO2_12_FULL_36_22]